MAPRLSLPYLHPVKNLHCTAVRRDKMERKKIRSEGETWRREVRGKKEQRQSKERGHCLLILAWLVMKRGRNVQCTKYIVQCVLCKHFLSCSMLNFSNICSVVVSKPPTEHQHCTHHCKRLPRPAELNIYHTDPHLAHVTFSLF